MKKYTARLFAALLSLVLLCSALTSCHTLQGGENGDTTAEQTKVIDYASSVELNMNSNTLKQKVTVKSFIDGDTTHFIVPTSVMPTGVLKARYLAINTPESTGKIEEYGKKASAFTKEKLSSASSIIIESDDGNWNADSTGGRYLVWVWYRTSESAPYRNLNIEILQEGLAIASNSSQNRYGSTATAAIEQARRMKLNVHSGQRDPDFYYGEAVELTLKELRCNIEDYNGVKVAFEGVITHNYSNTVYVEEYDPETDVVYGMAVYYGFGLNGEGLEVLSVGNRSRIVGTVQYYEAGGTYQVSGLSYRLMKPDDPNNIQKISEGNAPVFRLIEPDELALRDVTVEVGEDEQKTFKLGELSMNSSVRVENITVTSVYTTSNEDSSQKGAMTLTCSRDGKAVSVRTVVLYDETGALITAAAFEGKTISVRGLVDYYDDAYQIKVFSADEIEIVTK